MKNKITAMVVILVIFVVFLIPLAAFGEDDVPDLKAVYEEYCDSEWATLSGDGLSLSLDTNPSNKDDYTDFAALFAIEEVNKALGLPESVYTQMGNTTAMQGVQTYEMGSLTVSWSYHPDNGMEILYSIRVDSDQELTNEDLEKVYEENCDSEWATLSGDGLSLSLDTNPSNKEDYTDFAALFAIEEINKALGLPESVYTQMGSTTAMQGVQTYNMGNLMVSWSYHPDNGMEVLYSIRVDSDQELTNEDLEKVYEENCDSEWATLSGDGLSLSLDTNPSNKEDYTDFAALFAIEEVNKALGLPESVYTQMGSTTAMQGVQTYEMGNLMVSWSYHPDNGMQVLYSIKPDSDQELTNEDLKKVYEENCDSEWASLSGDGMSLSLDTNPSNKDDYTDFAALFAIEEVNKALGLPESVYTQMGSTTAMQGVQTYEMGNLTVSWSYHPDNGMQVLYSIKPDSDQELTSEDLKKVYEENCDSEWSTLSGDGMSLSLDTNPSNKDDYTDFAALFAIEEVNKALGLPESVYTQMGSTTAMQGVQTYEMGNLTVSWSYHPDNGMEVLYSIK